MRDESRYIQKQYVILLTGNLSMIPRKSSLYRGVSTAPVEAAYGVIGGSAKGARREVEGCWYLRSPQNPHRLVLHGC
jgi:hypothetical protein